MADWQAPFLEVPPNDFSQLELAAEKVAQMADGKPPRQPAQRRDLEAVAAAIRNKLAKGGRLSSFSARDLRTVAWVMFHAEGGARKALAEDSFFWPHYMKWLAGLKSASALKVVLCNFLIDYPQKMSTFSHWRSFLENQLRSRQKPSLRPWQKSNQLYGLLKENGVQLAAGEIWSNCDDWEDAFKDANLSGLLENSAFAQAVYRALLKFYQKHAEKARARTEVRTSRLLRFAVKLNEDRQEKMRYDGLGADLINTLLLPYDKGGGFQTDKGSIKKFLLRHFKDPRTRSAHWASAQPGAREVMKRWLVEDSLAFFLELLSATADPMWKYRKEFWEKYLEMGVIAEAWPVLGPKAKLKASRAKTQVRHGCLINAARQQSVLLLKIGDLIIAEWSHNGACRIWTRETEASRSNAPLLGRYEYDGKDDLRTDCEERIFHASSEKYGWQTKLAEVIRNHTGISINVRS